MEEFDKASVLMMGAALFLATSIGANPKNLSEMWVEIANELMKDL